jgi:uncharacterized protein YcaQ
MNAQRTLSAKTARRLAISRQQLATRSHKPTAAGILEVVRELGCLQLDPLSTVARSHTLVAFSRVGPYDASALDELVYKDRQLFEYWAHCASLVLTEDYPIHRQQMQTYLKQKDPYHQRIVEWIESKKELRSYILRELKRHGPVSSRLLGEGSGEKKSWDSSGWTHFDRDTTRMLHFLWMSGKIMVADRQGLNKYWDLSERVLPDWTPRQKMSAHEIVRHAAQRSLRALGVATERQIKDHFIQWRYPDLDKHLRALLDSGEIIEVEIPEFVPSKTRPAWYLHCTELPLVEAIERGEWQGQTVLLSPFDNLVRDRGRNRQFWDFDYTIEIYTPQAKRKYGYYVLPILHNEQLIGRIDPKMDRATGVLKINAVHVEPHAARDQKTGRAVRDAIQELGIFLGAKEIEYTERVPEHWKRVLK